MVLATGLIGLVVIAALVGLGVYWVTQNVTIKKDDNDE
jgi:hypothetical protein